MIKRPSWLHLPNVHRNGKVQEIQVPEEVCPLEDIEPIEEEESAGDRLPIFLDAQSWDVQEVPPSQAPLFDVSQLMTDIEQLVVGTYARITKAHVEFKTGANGVRYLQIHFALDRKRNKNQLARLKRQVCAKVGLRVGRDIEVVALELKSIPQDDSNDPPS